MATYIMLALALASAVGRNLISKAGGDRLSGIRNMLTTTAISAALALIVFGASGPDFGGITADVFVLALFYSAFSMLSPCLYIVAVGQGNVAVCSLIFGCSFLVPTFFGMIFYRQPPTVTALIGIALIVAAVALITGKVTRGGMRSLVPVTLAMLASGGLGVVQQLYSRSHSSDSQTSFIFLAFLFSLIISVTLLLIFGRGKGSTKRDLKFGVLALGLAVCIVTQNRFGLYLSGVIDASVLFPILNGGTIALSAILSAVLFGEKFGLRQALAVAAAIIAIVLIKM